MLKFKIFSGGSHQSLKDAHKWTAEPDLHVQIESIHYSTVVNHNGRVEHSILIVYTELPK